MNIRKFFATMLYTFGTLCLMFGGYQAFQTFSLTGYTILGDIGQTARGALVISFILGGLLICAVANMLKRRKAL